MPKILFVNATAELGGTDTDLLETVRALDKAKFSPAMLLPHPGPLDEQYRAIGVPVYYRNLGVIKRSDSRLKQLMTLALLPLVVWQLRAFIRREHFDLVYNNSLLLLASGFATRLAGKRAIWHSGEMYNRPLWLSRSLYRLVGFLAHRVIVSSEAVRHYFPASLRPKVITLNNGIDLSRFDPHNPLTQASALKLRKEFAIPPESPVIGFVGRFIAWKGSKEFLQACAEAEQKHGLQGAHYVVVGSLLDGYKTYIAEVQALATALGIGDKVHFATNRQDIPAFLALFDVFVHCSVKPEPFGIVIIEAMAMGKPLIASNAGGVPEIVDTSQIGKLVAPGNVSDLAKEIAALVADPQTCLAMSTTNYRLARERYEISRVTRAQEVIFGELLAPPKPATVLDFNCPPSKEISVVMVNFNGGVKVLKSLEALRTGLKELNAEVFIVDNASPDSSLRHIKAWLRNLPLAEQPNFRLIENRQNLGYAKANNIAIRQSAAEFVLLLNPDAEVEPTAIAKTLTFMRQNPQTGICGGKILLPTGKLDSPCRRSFKTPEIYLYKFLGLSKIFPKSRRFGKYYLSFLDENETTEVDAVIGAFMLIRREVIRQIGVLDERYFIYCEDEDWCFQAKNKGWRVYYYPEAVIHHQKGASTGQQKIKMIWEWHKAVFKFHRKNLAPLYPLPFNFLIYFGILLQLILLLILNLTKRLLMTMTKQVKE